MKAVITGALGNISRPLAEQLLAAGHAVTVVSHNPARKPAIESIGAKAAIGSVADGAFVTAAFRDADAVYTMVPPDFTVPDYNAFSRQVLDNYAAAIMQADVRHVVNLSSVGSALAGTSPLTGYQNLEERMNTLDGINLLHLRPGAFYTNFYGSIPLIMQHAVLGNNFNGDVMLYLTHPRDIAGCAFEAFTNGFSGMQHRAIVSDRKRGNEIATLLGTAIGKELRWMEFTDDQLLDRLTQNGFARDAAQHYVVNMGKAIREGLLERHYKEDEQEAYGRIGFEAFAQEFAALYRARVAAPVA
ncbi:MAG: NAD-dependent dehydratase [Sphingobacteriales bacterium]|nr:MAG: NAD-dependent dehydratase [Sphingobacteriales bacterium]